MSTAGRHGGAQARGLCRRPALSGHLLCSGKRRISAFAKAACSWEHDGGDRIADAARTARRYVLAVRVPRPAGEANRRHHLAAGRHRARAARSATSPARFPAEANPKSRNPSPTRCCKARSSFATITATWTQWRRSCSGTFRPSIKKSRRRIARKRRPILSPERSLGSVIQLLTPSAEYTDEHNEWLRAIAADRAPACLHREALLPAGVGRQLARALHRRSHQRILWATN